MCYIFERQAVQISNMTKDPSTMVPDPTTTDPDPTTMDLCKSFNNVQLVDISSLFLSSLTMDFIVSLLSLIQFKVLQP